MKGVLEWTDEEFHLLSSRPPIAVELGNCSPAETGYPEGCSLSDWTWVRCTRSWVLQNELFGHCSLQPPLSQPVACRLHSCSQVQLQFQGSLSFYTRSFFFNINIWDAQRNSSDFQASATQKCMGVKILGLPWPMHDRWSCINDFPLDVRQAVLWAVVLGSSQVETKQALVAQGNDQTRVVLAFLLSYLYSRLLTPLLSNGFPTTLPACKVSDSDTHWGYLGQNTYI